MPLLTRRLNDRRIEDLCDVDIYENAMKFVFLADIVLYICSFRVYIRNVFKFMTLVIYMVWFARVTCVLARVDFTGHSAKIIVK